MPGEFGKDPGLDLKTRIGAAIEILREQRLAFGMLEEIGVERFELFRSDRLIAGPPHVLVGGGVANGEFVFRTAPGEIASIGAQRAVSGQHRFSGSK